MLEGKGYVAGVKKKPDGTLDYSSAVTVGDPSKNTPSQEANTFDIQTAIDIASFLENRNRLQGLTSKSELVSKAKAKQQAKYESISGILKDFMYSGAKNPKELIVLLENYEKEFEDAIKKNPGDKELDKSSDSIREAIRFLEGEFIQTSEARTIDTPEYQKSKPESLDPKPQDIPKIPKTETLEERKARLDALWRASEAKKVQETAVIYKKLGVDSPDEREKSRERVAELVLRDGGIRVHTSVEKGLSQKGNDGFQNLDARIISKSSSGYTDFEQSHGFMDAQFYQENRETNRVERMKDILEKYKIREVVNIHHDMKEIYEDVVVKGKKGVLGFGGTPDRTERKATGRFKPVLHSEIVSGGKDEPVVRFTYYIPQQTDWTDYSGRGGQAFISQIFLPESVAKEVEKVLDNDPAVIRKIIEKVIKDKLLKDPTAWETPRGYGEPLRPPYEKWDAEPEGGIYIQKENETGFHKESLRKVKA